MIGEGYNIWAILVAAVAAIAIGMVWYAPPVLGGRWQTATGITQPGIQAVVLWAVCYLVLAFSMAYLFKHLQVSGLEAGFRWGSTLGAAIVAASVAPNYAFGKRPLGLFLIEMGYVFIAVTVIGVILGVWR
ncbi:MAG: DUF1761 domain-containing protein [bacterium]